MGHHRPASETPFRGSGPVLLRNPIVLWFFSGVRTPCLSSGSMHVTTWRSCVLCFLEFCHLPIWSLGSVVVLVCIDSWYLLSSLLIAYASMPHSNVLIVINVFCMGAESSLVSLRICECAVSFDTSFLDNVISTELACAVSISFLRLVYVFKGLLDIPIMHIMRSLMTKTPLVRISRNS